MTNDWIVSIEFPLPAAEDREFSRDELEDQVENILVHVDELHGVSDPDADIDYGKRVLRFNMYIDTPNVTPEDMTQIAVTSLRTALHAAGESTKGWDELLSRPLGKSLTASC